MVHQHFMLIPVMTVAENIVLATEPRHNGVFLDEKAAASRVLELSERFGLAVDPDEKVQNITVGQQQRVEILKALYRGAEILILDEPTAVLTPQEADDLFAIIRSLTAQGKSIIFISHKLNEVLTIADRITTLRRGKLIDTVPREGATEDSPGTDDGRPRRAAAGREGAGVARRAAARARRPPCVRRPRPRGGEGRQLHRARGRDRRPRRGRRERPVRADRRNHRASARRERHDHRRRQELPPRERPHDARRRASATSPRTGSGAGSSWTSPSPRTSRSTTSARSRTRSGAGSTRAG